MLKLLGMNDMSLTSFSQALIDKYNIPCPRYTSYPTAAQFISSYSLEDYMDNAQRSNDSKKPLSLYFHIPFCDTLCYYCGCNKIATKNKNKASEYLKVLHQEIRLQSQLFDPTRQVAQLHWGGGTPTFISEDEMQELMRVIRQHFNCYTDDSGEYAIEIDPRKVTSKTIKHLRNIGFNRMSVGIQDFNPMVQKAVNRNQPLKETREIIDSIRANQFKSLSVDLIYGLPHQTVISFEKTLQQTLLLDPDRISLFNFAYLPERFPAQRAIKLTDLPSPMEKLAILNLSIAFLEDSGYTYIGMDHFAKHTDELAVVQKEGGLYRNFQGYATNAACDLVAMGVTGIGSISNHYSQNTTSIEEYTKQITQGKLAISKGVKTDKEDQIRKLVIMELICHFHLSFKAIEEVFHINFSSYFKQELRQLKGFEQDSLITITPSEIQVLPVGRFFIRNICSTFDRHYTCRQNESFSKAI